MLLGLALWLPHWVPGGALGHFTATYLLLSLCLLAALLALERTPGTSPLWLGATPALALYAGLNWDLLPIALLAGAALALSRARPGTAGALTGLGISAKLFPGVLVLPALGGLAWGRVGAPSGAPRAGAGWARALRYGAATLAVVAAVNVPVALVAPEGWSWFFRFNAGRGAENSAWHALHLARGPLLEALSEGPVVLASLLGAWAAARAAARGDASGRAVRLAAAFALTLWIATSKVWSPQYALYGFLAGALASAPLPLFGALSAVSLLDFWAAFAVRGRRWDPAFRDLVFHPTALVRTALWLLLAAWLARELWRGEAASAGEAGPGGALPRPGA